MSRSTQLPGEGRGAADKYLMARRYAYLVVAVSLFMMFAMFATVRSRPANLADEPNVRRVCKQPAMLHYWNDERFYTQGSAEACHNTPDQIAAPIVRPDCSVDYPSWWTKPRLTEVPPEVVAGECTPNDHNGFWRLEFARTSLQVFSVAAIATAPHAARRLRRRRQRKPPRTRTDTTMRSSPRPGSHKPVEPGAKTHT